MTLGGRKFVASALMILACLCVSARELILTHKAEAVASSTNQVAIPNQLAIHLQSGFDGKRDVIITVNGREIYHGKPETNPLIERADAVAVTNLPPHPMVVFMMPDTGLIWSNRVDLTNGTFLAINITTNGKIRTAQATNLFYE